LEHCENKKNKKRVTPSCEASWASRSNAMMSSNSTLEAANCCTSPVGGDRLPAACSASSSCSSWIWAMQSPASRSCSSGPNLRAAIRRAASGGQPPETLPECYRDAASQSLCHSLNSSRWSHALLVSHHHHGADFESEPLFAHLPVTRAVTEP
jgi:hypothetical protein